MKKGKIGFYEGPLIESCTKGKFFIADEMNLSSVNTMKSLVPVLDPLLNKNILIPRKDKPFDIDNKFFFIACQNDEDNLGRNNIPEVLKRKLREIKYPKQKKEEIIGICNQKRIIEFGNGEEFTEENSKLLGEFMFEFNKMIDDKRLPLLKWSFRDIDKNIKRINEHIRNKDKYLNFKYYHFIYFYLLSSIPEKELNKVYLNKELLINSIHSKFIEIFKLDENSAKELKESFIQKPIANINEKSIFIMKGNIGIKFEDKDYSFLKVNILPNYYDKFFKLKLTYKEEPIILMGPSSYKTH